MIHLPASGVLFASDVVMPYLGQPFAGEGSLNGLLQALASIASLRPRLIIHGYTTLTEQFTAEAVPGLEAALTQLHGQVLDGILMVVLDASIVNVVLPHIQRALGFSGKGDRALALEIIQPGLLRHPARITLAGLRATVLYRLMDQYRQLDPFKFLIYAELAGAEIGPGE